ncbi:MAG: ABC transporter ATP-binding protein [Lachnospiraceae bacterium]|nr:ABC transporter ATP-binding protein [Lachnospiraceae bacterium]
MSLIIECKNLTKKYGQKVALDHISLDIESGQIVGLLGANGSGKTTFIKLLNGLLSKDTGEIRVNGHPVGTESKKMVSYLPERTYFPNQIRVREAVNMFQDFYADFHRERAEEMLQDLGIDLKMRFCNMSKGTREKLQLVLVMSREAKLYLLDEPIGGVDPAARDYIMKTILSNYQEDASIIISTHLISDVEKILDDIIFIQEGQIILHQKADDLRMAQNKSVDQIFREVFAC